MKSILFCALTVLLGIGSWVAHDLVRNAALEPVRSRPGTRVTADSDDALLSLHHGEEFPLASLEGIYQRINGRYDASDFHLQSLTRILYDYAEALSPAEFERLKATFIDFKYWMDQPGRDSLCLWSENHQILFAATEYLAGQYWPDEAFSNTGKTGAEHRDMARARILSWLEQRWLYGFTEWYSNVYYVEDIAPLANLIDFARDEEIVNKATMILDLLLHDVATQSYRGTFISTSGRLYESHKKDNHGNSMRTVIEHIWGRDAFGYQAKPRRGMELNFILSRNYKVPEVLRAIGLDEGPSIIKASNGLNVCELQGEGLLGQEDRQIMMQWAMESFTNPEVIENSLAYIENHDMLSNEFLHDFKFVNFGVLKIGRLLPIVSRFLQPVTNGTAIQRANTYTYRTPDFMIATAQAYHPGTYGDQHHIWAATLSEEVSLFTTHPAKALSDEGPLSGSPGYWVGSGRLPHSVQHENIVLSLYQLPAAQSFTEQTVSDFTHAYFPAEVMDEVLIEGRYAFGRHRNTLVAFVGRYPLAYAEKTTDDLIQPGKDSYWIFEASTLAQEGSLRAFSERVCGNSIRYRDRTLHYQSGGDCLRVRFAGGFMVNGHLVNTEHPRFDSPYASTPRKPRTVRIAHGEHVLELDFYGQRRESR